MENIFTYLESNGYKKYAATPFEKYADSFYQKKVCDEFGVKYFINFIHYSGARFGNGATLNDSIKAEIIINEPHQTYSIHHLNTLDKIKDSEQKIEQFWLILGSYYKKYE